uniref:ShKT domain-containing protein n=2 Tax=Caenorhabditis tropicalis TaxID=1561998 RepID=A0A1I7V2I3_9PELO
MESSLSGASSWSSKAAAPKADMSLTFVVVSVLALASGAEAVISGNYNCTTYNGTAFVYTPAATICSNTISDASCQVLYAAPNTLYPAAGNDAERAYACYTTASATPATSVNDMVQAAYTNCPKTCGFCCMTSAYNCANVAYPRLTCSTITAAQCQSSVWRTIIAQDCPSACGFCNQGGCVDAVVDCANDISICTAVGMQTFVNTYCQRTCNRCASSTTAASSSSSTCTSYNADSSTACTSWAANGFCTNTFYTTAQRKAYCATTCKLC